jgi:hypothetical protein
MITLALSTQQRILGRTMAAPSAVVARCFSTPPQKLVISVELVSDTL